MEEYTKYFRKRVISEEELERNRQTTYLWEKRDLLMKDGYDQIVGSRAFRELAKADKSVWINTLYDNDIREIAKAAGIRLFVDKGWICMSIERVLFLTVSTYFDDLLSNTMTSDGKRIVTMWHIAVSSGEIQVNKLTIPIYKLHVDMSKQAKLTKDQIVKVGKSAMKDGDRLWRETASVKSMSHLFFTYDHKDERYVELLSTKWQHSATDYAESSRKHEVDRAISASMFSALLLTQTKTKIMEQQKSEKEEPDPFIAPDVRQHFLQANEDY